VNFKDATSGTFLKEQFGVLEKQVQNGVPTSQIKSAPWFENQMGGTAFCETIVGLSCSQIVTKFFGQLVNKGDLSDTIQQLAFNGLLDFNVGLPAQTGANGYIGNFASSNYNALLLNVRKRFSQSFQFKFNYTYSHSIDNVSAITNDYVTYTGTGDGLVCDLTDSRACRASSDFDARHMVSGDYIYDLPVGRGRSVLQDAPKWLDAFIGGWSWSGIVTYRTGYPFTINTGAFPTDFTLDAPAVVTGPLKTGIHTDVNGNLQYFADPTATLSKINFPFAGAVGNRNAAQGPGFFNVDMGITKSFQVPWSEKQHLKFRWDSFNTFNHPSFNGPGSATLSNTSSFGIINSTASSPRVSQIALRYEF